VIFADENGCKFVIQSNWECCETYAPMSKEIGYQIRMSSGVSPDYNPIEVHG
jgi:hypothetical protein